MKKRNNSTETEHQVCIIFSQKIPSIARPGALVKHYNLIASMSHLEALCLNVTLNVLNNCLF